MDKPSARRAALAARAALPPDVRAAGDRARDALLAPLLEGRRVATYEAFGTRARRAAAAGRPGAAAAARPRPRLAHRRRPAAGVGAVAGCDVVLVPALAVDRRGTRLGRGGGSYDRALARARGLVVALLHEGELADLLPAEPHDVRVDVVALPSGLVRVSDLTSK